MTNTSEITFVTPRPSVEIHLPDGRVLSGPRGATVEQFLKVLDDQNAPIVGAVVNYELLIR
jgi:hypothetical protein